MTAQGRRVLTSPYLLFTIGVLALTAAAFLLPLGADLTPFVLVLIPPIVAVSVTAIRGGWTAVRALLARVVRWRVDPRWYLAAIGIPILEKIVVDAIGWFTGAASVARLVESITPAALVVTLVVLLPALLEELGWRGFAVQTALDRGHSRLWATLVTSVLFLAVHVPLYLPGQIYDGLPFWPVVPLVLAQSILLTWVYVGTGSVLLAGLMHAAFNATVPLTWGLDPAWVWQIRPLVLIAICILLAAMSRSFRSLFSPVPATVVAG